MTAATAVFLSDPAARLCESVVAIVDRSRPSGHGAGFASANDLFVTSAHVVSERKAIVITQDGRAFEGTVVARDVERDVAVVRAPRAELPPATFGDPYSLRPGSLVFAVGHPLGVKDAVSVGVFQAVRPVPQGYGLAEQRSTRRAHAFIPWVQADVRLGPGNSGGPIADSEGHVIGVATMIVSGLALAVPAPDVERLLERLG